MKLFIFLLAALIFPAAAADFRTTNAATALYDAPSAKGKKLFVVFRETPLDLVVTLEGWSKVRDAEGGMYWIESRYLSEKRTVVVVAPRAEIRRAADGFSPLVFEAEKNVSLELIGVSGGWAQVKHRDGQSGYVRLNQIWGI